MATTRADDPSWPTADAPAEAKGEMWVLRLYVAGGSPRSVGAIRNVTRLCEDHLAGRVDLRIIDIFQQPSLAAEAQLLAAPTLIRERPIPLRRFIGNLTSTGALFASLEPAAPATTGSPVGAAVTTEAPATGPGGGGSR
jgi:circadian clock protein KaiB